LERDEDVLRNEDGNYLNTKFESRTTIKREQLGLTSRDIRYNHDTKHQTETSLLVSNLHSVDCVD
jgi:hypothetical protein